jgi:hypothetical protein
VLHRVTRFLIPAFLPVGDESAITFEGQGILFSTYLLSCAAFLRVGRDALLESMAKKVLEALDSLTGEEKSRIYRMLRLEVTPTTEGCDVSGALCTSLTPSR